MPLKTLLVILDGLGDRCHEVLGGKTPLEYAHTPNLDALAQRSETGVIYTLEPGLCLNTDLAHLILFGYTLKDYPGRAIIDLFGEDVIAESGQLVLRTSWAHVEGEGPYYLKERFVPELSHFNALTLGDSISGTFEGYHFEWRFSHDSHGFLTLEGPGLSCDISDTDPFYKDQYVMACEPMAETRQARFTADLVNRYLKFITQILRGHEINHKRTQAGLLPANMLLVKWAGMQKDVDAFEVQNGMVGKLIAGSKLLRGLASYMDLGFVMEKDFGKAIEKALMSSEPFICVHTKAPDEAAHTKSPLKKVEVIEALDADLKGLLDVDLDEWQVVVTSDHSTPSSGALIHSGESVPILFYGRNTRPDAVACFDERSCLMGTHRIKGKDLMPLILNYSDRANLYHLNHGTKHRLYRPVQINALK